MANRGRPAAGLTRVKWTARVDPGDVGMLKAIRTAKGEQEGRRVSDAEVFRMAVAGLARSLPEAVRKRLGTIGRATGKPVRNAWLVVD